MEGVVSGFRQIVGELLDAGLVRNGGEGVRRARVRFGGVLAARTVHFVQSLRLRVVGLELVVGDRPCRRDAVVVLQLTEVLLAQAVQRGAVQLRRASDEVVNLRLKGLAVGVVPRVFGDVAVVDEHVAGKPVLRLTRKPVAALEQQDLLARRCEMPGKRPAARAGSDDDDVVVVHRQYLSVSSGSMIRAAASISARCENAWGKFPRCLPVLASNSSAYSPSGEAMRRRRSIRSRALCISPMT